jgi:hypothetical protein
VRSLRIDHQIIQQDNKLYTTMEEYINGQVSAIASSFIVDMTSVGGDEYLSSVGVASFVFGPPVFHTLRIPVPWR